jgi:hypothetical protein
MRLYVPLTRTEFDRLRDLALSERRRPQDQAAVLLARALAVEHVQPATDESPGPVTHVKAFLATTESERVPA